MSFSLVNFFLSQLESQFPTLYHSLSLNDWILLLPVGLLARLLCQPLTFGEQTGCLTPLYDPHFLTLESLGTHILTHSTSASTFVTLDHKQVSLDYARKTLTGTQGIPYIGITTLSYTLMPGFSKTLTTTILSDGIYVCNRLSWLTLLTMQCNATQCRPLSRPAVRALSHILCHSRLSLGSVWALF